MYLAFFNDFSSNYCSQARELEIGVYYRDYRSLCGITFLKLVDFLDNQRHELKLSLEPVGTLRCEVRKAALFCSFFNLFNRFLYWWCFVEQEQLFLLVMRCRCCAVVV